MDNGFKYIIILSGAIILGSLGLAVIDKFNDAAFEEKMLDIKKQSIEICFDAQRSTSTDLNCIDLVKQLNQSNMTEQKGNYQK